MAEVMRMDGKPWTGSDRGVREWRRDVAQRVAWWRRRRALEAWVLPASVIAAVLFAWRAFAWGRAWALALSAAALASVIAAVWRRGNRG